MDCGAPQTIGSKAILKTENKFVVINKTSSNCSTIACSVPQGSILGPLLFILYINDLNTVSDVLRTIMFADDTNLFLMGKNLDEIKIVVVVVYLTTNQRHMGYLSSGNGHLAGRYSTP